MEPEDLLELGRCTVDLRARTATAGTTVERLTTREVDLLRYLAARLRTDVSRDALLVEVFGYAATSRSRAVDAAIKRLRKKLDDRDSTVVLTVHGVGYRLEPGGASATEAPREAAPDPTPLLRLGPVVVDLDRLRVEHPDGVRALSSQEAGVLSVLRAHGGRVVDADTLAREVWGRRSAARFTGVHSALRRLRSKIEVDPGQPRFLLGIPREGWRLASGVRDGRSNLAPVRPGFVGRRAELVDLVDALVPGALVAVLGPGGVGKTRLADAAVRAWLRSGRSATLVSLAEARGADEVQAALGEALAIPAGDDPDRVGRALAARGAHLWWLDDLEHALPEVAERLDGWSRAAPQATVLVTSRVPVGLPRVCSVRLGPLPSADAVALFVDRVQQRRPGLDLQPADREVVAEIAARLDGLPLALELAAARVDTASISGIRDRLQQRFQLLRGADEGRPARHEALWSTLEWSWELLEPWAQQTLAQLSTFRGWLALADAEAVLSVGDPAPWAPDVLRHLADRSWLEPGPDGPEPTFRLLESTRAFAAHHHVDPESAERRHAEHVITTAEAACTAMEGEAPGAATSALARWRADLLAAVERAAQRGWHSLVVRAAQVLDRALYLRGPWSTRDRVLELGLVHAETAAERACMLRCRAESCRVRGRFDESELVLQHAENQVSGTGRTMVSVWVSRARLERDRGELEAAARAADRALVVARAESDPTLQAEAWVEVAATALAAGGAGSLDAAREALRANRSVGRRRGVGLCLAYAGLALAEQGRHAEAGEHFAEALRVFEVVASGAARGVILTELARLGIERGRWAEAPEVLRFAVGWFDRIGDTRLAAHCSLHLGLVAHGQGELDGADADYGQAARRFEVLHDDAEALMTAALRASLLADRGQTEPAAQRLLAVAEQARSQPRGVQALVELCWVPIDRARAAAVGRDASAQVAHRVELADALADAEMTRSSVWRLTRARCVGSRGAAS